MIPWLCAAALAADPVGATLNEQLERNVAELSLPEAPPIYHLRYSLLDMGQVDVVASLGSLVYTSTSPYKALGVDVRVGSPDLDNTGFGGWQDGFGRAGLPVELTEQALATAAWRLTDQAYKEAVEQYARKTAQWSPPADHPGDYTLTGPVVADLGAATAETGTERLSELAVALSAALVSDPPLLRGEVYVGHEAGSLRIVDTEETDVRVPVQETTIRVTDGTLLTDQRLWTVRGAEDLPAAAELVAEVESLRDGLLATAAAPAFAEEYVGPVLLEGDAALALFRYVLVPQLEGTPADIPFDSFFGELGDARDPVRVGRRVLPPGWRVVDDPTVHPDHPGSYLHDMEGTATRAVELVADGIVRDLVMSRVPRRGVDGTNGHARGMVGSRLKGRVADLEVDPDKHRSEASLLKRALKLARAYGRDHVLIVRRLQEPSVLQLDGIWFDGDEQGTTLPPPVEVIRHYADGREEVLRGAAFASVQRWILRDIVAAGPDARGSFLAPLVGGYASLDPTEGLASALTAPAVLLGEAELVPSPGDPRDVAVLPPPDLPSPSLAE